MYISSLKFCYIFLNYKNYNIISLRIKNIHGASLLIKYIQPMTQLSIFDVQKLYVHCNQLTLNNCAILCTTNILYLEL